MRITLRPVALPDDVGLLHAWVTHPRSVFWQMQGATPAQVHEEYAAIARAAHHDAWIGLVDGVPEFLCELYDPHHSELAGTPELLDGDIGMHVLVAPPRSPVPGFSRAVFGAVMRHCFADPGVRRVVVEPDQGNQRILALNAAAGFRVVRSLPLPGKMAALSFCTRAAFDHSELAGPPGEPMSTPDHLTPDLLAAAQRALVTKAIGEAAHERMVAPRPEGDHFRLDGPESSYTFTAEVLPLEHWVVDPNSVRRTVDGAATALDAQAFVIEFRQALGIPDELLATYLEEVASTLASSCWKRVHRRQPVADLADAPHQVLEAAMTEGHPAFIANNGRIGFSDLDHATWSPEAGQPVRLLWLAARRDCSHLSLGRGVLEAEHWTRELGEEQVTRFKARLSGLGLGPEDYHLLPVHPWQWHHKVAIAFAPDLARRDLVLLGEGDDRLQAQQSIRTFYDLDHPERSYTKVALSIQNMGFMRGLSPAYMRVTPAINDWVADVVAADPELRARGFGVLREHAAIGYTGDAYHVARDRSGVVSAHSRMLAALWRESPLGATDEGDQLATMAALLHRDHDGRSLAGVWIGRSGLSPAEWVRRYLAAYVRPVVHCLLAHDLAFMPHGENLIMVMRDHVPTRMLMKDIGEEVALVGPAHDHDLPQEISRIRGDCPDDVRALALHTDVFDGFLRHLAGILHADGLLAADAFWSLVRECVTGHEADHPELADAVARYQLTRPRFRHSCLNRLQLRNTMEMVDITDQAESLIFAGTLANPIASPARAVSPS